MKIEIRKTMIDIASILASNDELSWAKKFENLSSELDINYEASLFSLKKIYGGMGSFNDIVLHKDGVPLVLENEELDNLRHKLYKQLKMAIDA